MPVKTSKTFDFTIFAEDLAEDVEWLKELEVNKITASIEVCPDTQRDHIQGQATFKRSYSYAALKKLHSYAHWEMTMCEQDANYCRKRDSKRIIDIDNRKKKGARTDIAETKEVVRSTLSMKAVVEQASSVQSVRMAELWLKYNEPKRPIDPTSIKIHWRWGKTGANKTRFIWDTHHIDEVYTPTSYKWWEGYDGHKVVLIDELRANWCTFGELLKLLDIYPYTVETKGGSRQIQATTWFITSSYPPSNLFNPHHFDANERVDQLTRRLTSIKECEPPETPQWVPTALPMFR